MKAKIKTGIRTKHKVMIQKICVKKLLLLIKAFGGISTSLLSIKLINIRCWQKT